MAHRNGGILAGGSSLHPLTSQVGPSTFDIVTLAYSEVTCFLPASPCNHVFTMMEQDTCMSYGLGTYLYEYSVADCKEIDESLFEGVLRPFLENLKPIVMPEQTSVLQIQPLISINSEEQKRVHRTIMYEVENLFPEDSCMLPSENIGDNSAGGYIFHKAMSLPAGYKRELLGIEWCQSNRPSHFFSATMRNTFGQVVILKVYVNEMEDLKQVAVDLLTSDGKVKRYKTLKECFSANDPVKQAVKGQLLPMVDTIVKSGKNHFQSSSGESSSESIEQSYPGQLFEPATPVPPSQYPTLQARSRINIVSKKEHAVTRWLHDDLTTYHSPKLDPLLDPNCFKRGREHVGEPSTVAGGPIKYSRKTVDEKHAHNLMMKMPGELPTSDRGESGFSSAQMSRYSSFNRDRHVMQKERQLSMEIEADLLKTEVVEDEDDNTDEDKI